MAMTTCRKCQGEVSSEAVICPQCGATNPGKAESAQPVILVGCFFWVFLAIVAWGAWYWWPLVSDWWSSVSGGGLVVIETCDDLVPHIVELSNEADRPLRIFQLYDVTDRKGLAQALRPDRERRRNVLFCHAVAATNVDAELGFYFWLEEDGEGNSFYGFRPSSD